MKLKTTIFFGLFTFYVFAQPVVEVRGNTTDIATFMPGVNEKKYDDVKGSPYLQEDFTSASINDLRKTQFVRFNAVDHAIEAKTENGIMRLDLTKNYTIKLLDGSDRTYVLGNYKNEEEEMIRTFYQVLDSIGNHTFYKRERKKFIRKEKKQAYQDDQKNKFIEISDAYYISDFKSNGNDFLEIPRKKKKFYDFFGSHSKKVAQFVKKDKLDISNGDDLVLILAYYFSLQK